MQRLHLWAGVCPLSVCCLKPAQRCSGCIREPVFSHHQFSIPHWFIKPKHDSLNSLSIQQTKAAQRDWIYKPVFFDYQFKRSTQLSDTLIESVGWCLNHPCNKPNQLKIKQLNLQAGTPSSCTCSFKTSRQNLAWICALNLLPSVCCSSKYAWQFGTPNRLLLFAYHFDAVKQ